MNPHRLPTHVVPLRYDLHLEPDLTAFTFTGSESVTVQVREATSDLLLNAAELEILEAAVERVGDGAGGLRLRGGAEMDEEATRCRLRFPEPLSPGEWRLHIAFKGILNDKLRGFYRSRYKDETGTTHVLAATQFEATDARRAFPCWDEPAFKAVFAVTLAIDPALTAVSNTAIRSDRIEHGRKIVRFHDTIKMSTYLVAFVVGRLEATPPVMIGATPLRVWAAPGKGRLAAFGQDIGAFSLRFFEDYYGMRYPGDKLDLLAIPDFASGAMENLGAITFRENALLLDERAATQAERERVADVVAHENAHMWFGDLVTMSWWNGLWLNEAFATFMEMLAVDAWKPEWRRWETFGAGRAAAMIVDGLHSTRPVLAPKDADAMFDVLTYEKGASILRMLEQHLGPEVFRDGIRGYLRAHAYGSADTCHLWAALEEVSRQPVPDLMDDWIFRPGYPLVSAEVDARGDLALSQQRFTYLPEPEDAQRWQVPVQVRVSEGGRATTRSLVMTGAETRVSLPRGFASVLLNAGGHGFYRVRYSPELLERLLDAGDQLSGIERFNLVNDAWAAAVAGLIPLADYLDLTARLRGVRDRNVWGVVVDSFHALNRLVAPSERPGLEALLRDRVGPAAADLGWVPRAEEEELTRQLRGDLLRALGIVGNDTRVQGRAAELYAACAGGDAPEALDPNVLAAIIGILAHTGDTARYGGFLQAFRASASPQEERRYLFSLAAFREPALQDRTLALTLNGEIRTQDGPFVIHAMLMSVFARERAWAFVKANWDRMDQMFPKTGLRRMCGGVVGLATPELEQDVRQFFADRKIDFGGKTLAQYLEQLRIWVTLREREGQALSRYLGT
jgi:puromycin-sensitive aminopeptidase